MQTSRIPNGPASALKVVLFTAFFIAGLHGAKAKETREGNPLAVKVEMRLLNQNPAEIFKAVSKAGGMAAEYSGETTDVVSEWKANGQLNEVLNQIALKFGLCIYFDGIKLHAVSSTSANIEIIGIREAGPSLRNTLSFAVPWFSSNAISFDRAHRTARICGSQKLVEMTREIFARTSDRIFMIRYAIPDRQPD